MTNKVVVNAEEIVSDLLAAIEILHQPGRRIYRVESVIKDTISKIHTSPKVSASEQAISYETPIELEDPEVEEQGS